MARRLHIFDRPQRFVAGTVGEPGERVFYLQATDGAHTVSVALEKEQVRILAERVEDVIDEVTRRGDVPAIEVSPGDLDPLEIPLLEEFRVAARMASIVYSYPRLCHRLLSRYQNIVKLYYDVLRGRETYQTFYVRAKGMAKASAKELLLEAMSFR